MRLDRVAILGATGLVGRTMVRALEERHVPVERLELLASARSAGNEIPFRGAVLTVRDVESITFDEVDLVLASAGASVSKRVLPRAAEAGAISIDNSSAFRMDPDVPLVVPEVNAGALKAIGPRRLIANPNCSTIQLVVVLEPIRRAFGLERIVVATYQSVSGAGAGALEELRADSSRARAARAGEPAHFAKTIAFNVLPHIDDFMEDGSTREEWKMREETKKILGEPVELHATCVRVPVAFGHAEAVWIETRDPVSPPAVRECLAGAPGVELVDDPSRLVYPTPLEAEGRDEVLVGRIRQDPTIERGIALWIVSDNVRKGAATNAVQIAEALAASAQG